MLTPIQDTFTIPLTQGHVALVDERDFYRLRKNKWFAHWAPKTRSFYAARMIPHPLGGKLETGHRRRTMEPMHRIVLGLESGDPREVDHLDHNTLDNRRMNLRPVTRRGNGENRRDQSRYGPGIVFERRSKRRPFWAHVWIENRQHRIGCFATAEEARKARRKFLEEKALG